MSKSLFFKYLISLSLGFVPIIIAQSFIPVFQDHQVFSWVSLLFFILFTFGVFYLAEKAAQSPSLNIFSSVILGVIFIKMIFIIFIVLVYKELANPNSPWFLIPFFIIYLVFTIFEVYFMSKLGKTKPKKSEVQSTNK